ncbi:MAG: methyltransferase domain-containing protein, partial [Planctomycetaceae bacterium]|nr:methyltransferase domain-containing protein [Planctomycetaceae bacterium]
DGTKVIESIPEAPIWAEQKSTWEEAGNEDVPGIKAVINGIIGMEIDGEKDVDMEFAVDFEFEKLQNKKVTYHVKIFEIREKILPELDDVFFQKVNVKDLEDDDEGFDNAVLINCIRARQKNLDVFARSFRDFQIEYEQLAAGFFQVRIRTQRSLRRLLCFAGVIALINAIQNHEFRNVADDMLIKYARFIQYLDAPYFVRYQFKANLIQRGAIFDKLRQYLDTDKIKFVFGHNLSQRMRFVEKHLAGSVIVDVGCGEGKYLRLATKAEKYYAVDRDEDCREKTLHKAEKLGVNNAVVLESLDDLPEIAERKTVLLTEVIEHNTQENALELLRKSLLPNSRVIVTTPNRDFNIHYTFEDNDEPNDSDNDNDEETSFRHEGHLFEFTGSEFQEFIAKGTENINAEIQFFQLGDCVEGITPQSAAVIDVSDGVR